MLGLFTADESVILRDEEGKKTSQSPRETVTGNEVRGSVMKMNIQVRVYWALAQGRRPEGWMVEIGEMATSLNEAEGYGARIDAHDPTLSDEELIEAVGRSLNAKQIEFDPKTIAINRDRLPVLHKFVLFNAGRVTAKDILSEGATLEITRSAHRTAIGIRQGSALLMMLRINDEQLDYLQRILAEKT